MAKNSYPSPCLNCSRSECAVGCQDWQIRYRYRQKQINAYAKSLQHQKSGIKKFTYEHPDHTRRYLQEGPCSRCRAESVCDTPCPAYLRWYNARMQIVRKKVGM